MPSIPHELKPLAGMLYHAGVKYQFADVGTHYNLIWRVAGKQQRKMTVVKGKSDIETQFRERGTLKKLLEDDGAFNTEEMSVAEVRKRVAEVNEKAPQKTTPNTIDILKDVAVKIPSMPDQMDRMLEIMHRQQEMIEKMMDIIVTVCDDINYVKAALTSRTETENQVMHGVKIEDYLTDDWQTTQEVTERFNIINKNANLTKAKCYSLLYYAANKAGVENVVEKHPIRSEWRKKRVKGIITIM